jgi:hypothetical protein
MGGAPQVQAPAAPNTAQEYAQSQQTYIQNAPQLYQEESQYQPLYNQMNTAMNTQNLNTYAALYQSQLPGLTQSADQANTQAMASQAQNLSMFGPGVTQSMFASNPAFGQLQSAANRQLQQGQTPDQTLSGILSQVQGAIPGQVQAYQNLGSQVGMNTAQTNQQFQALSDKVGADTTAADLTQIRNQVAADPRSAIFNQTAGQVMGQLGQVDPLTAQLQQQASQQLALGGKLSAQEAQDVDQQSRAAFSARGMLNSGASMGAELLNRDQYSQQRMQQQQQFASGVSALADQQQQERTTNALGLTATDIAATQNNMQMAGSMTQAISGINQGNVSLQSGLQGQIASNLAQSTQQQAALIQGAQSAFSAGQQQAAGLQGSILDQQYRQQQAGTTNLQYLTGMSQATLSQLLSGQGGGGAASQQIAGMAQGATGGTGAPNLFNSSGVLQLTNQNNMAAMNAQGGANIANAQAQSAAQGQTMAAGAAGVAAIATIAGAALL